MSFESSLHTEYVTSAFHHGEPPLCGVYIHNFATYNTTCTLLSCESYMLGNYDACQLKTFAKCSGYENYPVNYTKEHIHRDACLPCGFVYGEVLKNYPELIAHSFCHLSCLSVFSSTRDSIYP